MPSVSGGERARVLLGQVTVAPHYIGVAGQQLVRRSVRHLLSLLAHYYPAVGYAHWLMHVDVGKAGLSLMRAIR